MIKSCGSCGAGFEAKRASATFCSSRCRTRNARGVSPSRPVALQPPGEGALTSAARRELEAAARLDTLEGQSMLMIAKRLDAGAETGAAMAAMVRELRTTKESVLRGVKIVGDPLDELRAKRDAKRAG